MVAQISRTHTHTHSAICDITDTQVYMLSFAVLKIKSKFSKIERNIMKKYAIQFIRWSEIAIQKELLQCKKINPIDDMIERTHTKLTDVHGTTYYINVHKQFIQNTLLSIENMFE